MGDLNTDWAEVRWKSVEGREDFRATVKKIMSESRTVPQRRNRSKSSSLARCAVIIPTYNAGTYWKSLHEALERQGLAKDQILFVDSSSSDGTGDLIRRAGYRLEEIASVSFNHGGTRQMASNIMFPAEFLVFLTQDAIPCGPDSIERLLHGFQDPAVGACYGRQLPRLQAGAIERHARLFNYPGQSEVRTLDSRRHLGIRAAYFSNSFAAYRRTAFEEVGGFPTHTIVSEEVSVVAKMLLANWKIAYEASATVIHSHSFSNQEEFSRYFDIGVHHRRERSLMQEFGGPGSEGLAFVTSELKFLWESNPSLIPSSIIRTFNKWLGYNLGLREKMLPNGLKQAISGQPNFWRQNRVSSHYDQVAYVRRH